MMMKTELLACWFSLGGSLVMSVCHRTGMLLLLLPLLLTTNSNNFGIVTVVGVQAVAPEYRGSAEAGTPEGAILAAGICVGLAFCLVVGIMSYRYYLRRQWQQIVKYKIQQQQQPQRQEICPPTPKSNETNTTKTNTPRLCCDVVLPKENTPVSFKAYLQHSSIQDKTNITMGQLTFHHHPNDDDDNNDETGIISTDKQEQEQEQQQEQQNIVTIQGSGGDSMGQFRIVRGELVASTGKFFWLEDFSSPSSSSSSSSLTVISNPLVCCSFSRQQILVTGKFDVVSHNRSEQPIIMFREGEWIANDGASGRVSCLQFTPPLLLQVVPASSDLA